VTSNLLLPFKEFLVFILVVVLL